MKAVSPKKLGIIEESAAVRAQYREEHPFCELGIIIAISEGSAEWCVLYTQGIHERKKRSQQGSLTDPTNLMSSCNPCNGWVEDNPKLAKKLGLVVESHQDPSEVYVYREER